MSLINEKNIPIVNIYIYVYVKIKIQVKVALFDFWLIGGYRMARAYKKYLYIFYINNNNNNGLNHYSVD